MNYYFISKANVPGESLSPKTFPLDWDNWSVNGGNRGLGLVWRLEVWVITPRNTRGLLMCCDKNGGPKNSLGKRYKW